MSEDFFHKFGDEMLRCADILSMRGRDVDIHYAEDGEVIAISFNGRTYEPAPSGRAPDEVD